jgi:hypothetical protein
MDHPANPPTIQPPWGHPQFLSEEGLRAAQEYYFQTHATHSQLIAQGRGAQGLAKSMLRRKLSREMGDDFKMYTGHSLGESAGSEDVSSLGIRGELNALLKHIYSTIAPQQPITSPTQEDLTILQHPHGALEVCYALVFYYGSLMRQYASFAANKRKVLKSLMDEELFKWVWRMVIGYMMEAEEAKLNLEPVYFSAGLSYIPTERQRVPLGIKLSEVGQFLLSTTLQESHLRVPLCYYYTLYLRQLQTLLALHAGPQELDDVYSLVTRRVPGEPMEHALAAIDALLNDKGSSTATFDDVLRDEAQLGQFIPEAEFAFINQFEDFGNPQRIRSTLKRLLPDMRRDAVEGQESSFMPLLLALRVMPVDVRDAVLAALPIPLLNLLRNRIGNSPQDDLAATLLDAVRTAMEARRGQSFKVQVPAGATKGAVATSVRVAPPGGTKPAVAASVRVAAPPAPAARAAPAAAPPGSAAPVAASPTAKPVSPAPEPAQRAAPAPPTAAPPPPARERPAAPPAQPREAPATAAPAGAPARAAAARTSYLEEPTILAWRMDGARVAAISLSARDLFELVGAEPRFLVPWVVFTLRTGQVFGLAPERVTKERVEQVVQALHRQAGAREGTIPAERRAALLQEHQGAAHARLLLGAVKVAGTRPYLRLPPSLAPALEALGARFGAGLLEFLRHPNDDAWREQRAALTADERQALAVLQRVARGQ